MIKLTIGALCSQGMQMALHKLMGAQTEQRTAYKFKKFMDEYNKALNRVREDYKKEVSEKFGELDEKGNIVLEPTKPWGFKLKEGVTQEEFDAANDEYNKKTVTIDRMPITLMDLQGIKISAAELGALDVLIAYPEETDQEEPASVHQLRR